MLRPHHRRRSSAAAQAAQIEQRARRRSSLHAPSPISGAASAVSGAELKEEAGMDLDTGKSDQKGAVGGGISLGKPSLQPSSKAEPPLAAKTVSPLDEDMSDLTNSMSALQFVPASVRFGRGKGKVGFSKR
jgi:hypothetical protein